MSDLILRQLSGRSRSILACPRGCWSGPFERSEPWGRRSQKKGRTPCRERPKSGRKAPAKAPGTREQIAFPFS